MTGKDKCKMLREIRRRIAEENDIELITKDCTYQGACRGTCPKCEAELRYLEQKLERRRSLGLRVSVAALAVGMTVSMAGCVPVGEQLEGDVPSEVTPEPTEYVGNGVKPVKPEKPLKPWQTPEIDQLEGDVPNVVTPEPLEGEPVAYPDDPDELVGMIEYFPPDDGSAQLPPEDSFLEGDVADIND